MCSDLRRDERRLYVINTTDDDAIEGEGNALIPVELSMDLLDTLLDELTEEGVPA